MSPQGAKHRFKYPNAMELDSRWSFSCCIPTGGSAASWWDARGARLGSGCPLTSVSQGQSLHNQSRIRQLTLGGVPLLRRAEVQAEGAVMWSEGATRGGAPVGLLPPREGETGGAFGLSGGCGAVALPRPGLLPVAPVGTSPLSQRAHDGVGDVGWCGGVGARRDRGTMVGLLGGSRALLSHSSHRLLQALAGPLPLAPAAPSLLQDSFHVVPESTLGAVVAAGGEFGDLEGRVGRPLTAPLDGLQLATDAVDGVVTAVGRGRAAVHPAGGTAAVWRPGQRGRNLER